MFRKEVLSYKRQRLEGTVLLNTPKIYRFFLFSISFFVVLSIVFIVNATYVRKAKVSGVILPNLGIVHSFSDKRGIVSKIFVSEGSVIKKGEPLVLLISEEFNENGNGIKQEKIDNFEMSIHNLSQKLLDQKKLNKLELLNLKQSFSSLIDRQKQKNIQSKVLQQRVDLRGALINKIKILAVKDNISDFEFKKQMDNFLSLKQQFAALISEKLQFTAQIEKLNNDIQQFPFSSRRNILNLEQELANLKLKLKEAQVGLRSYIVAQHNGVVTSILSKSGQNLNIGQKILSIIPENSEMQAILYSSTANIGMINIGQIVKIRYQAYPYQRFGIYTGKVVEIGKDLILPDEAMPLGVISAPAYRIIVSLDNQLLKAYGKEFSLRTGMQLEADINLEELSLIDWLFDPIYSLKGRF